MRRMSADSRACKRCGQPVESPLTGLFCNACRAAAGASTTRYVPSPPRTGALTPPPRAAANTPTPRVASPASDVRPVEQKPQSAVVAPSGVRDMLPASIGGHAINGILGSGGMGKVYLAREPVLGREVALKVVKRDPTDLSATQDLLAEALVTGRLSHAGIVPIHQVGRDPQHGLWYTMKVVDGISLADVLAGLREELPDIVERYTLPALLDIFRRTCDAVAFAHHNGVVNRDLKPSNVMIGAFGEVLVMDWGLARGIDAGEDRKRVMEAGAALMGGEAAAFPQQSLVPMIKGTPGYMSPEQAQAKPAGPASDVYALGAILYQILTLRLPVDGKTTPEIIQKTVAGAVIPPEKRSGARGLPKAMCQAAMKALSLDPASRHADARELAKEVEAYLDGRTAWQPREEGWHSVSGAWDTQQGRLRCGAGVKSKIFHKARLGGDLRLQATLSAGKDASPTDASLSFAVPGLTSTGGYMVRFVTGDPGRVEFHRNGAIVTRRLGLPLDPSLDHDVLLVREGPRVRLFLDGAPVLDHREFFPMRGDRLAVSSDATGVSLAAVRLESHGAPLHLDFMALPDKVHALGNLKEARLLYRELAETHGDRTEGIVARYKAAICSVDLGELGEAQADLKLLEGSGYEALGTLGLAKIRQKEGRPKEMWTVLLQGLEKHRGDPARIELRAAISGVLEQKEKESPPAAREMYAQLLTVPGLMPQETAQVTAEHLRLAAAAGPDTMRLEAMSLLEAHPARVELRMQCHLALARMKLPVEAAAPARALLEKTLDLRTLTDDDRANAGLWLLESWVHADNMPRAQGSLASVAATLDPASPAALRVRFWRALLSCAQGNWADAGKLLETRPVPPPGPSRFLGLLLAANVVAAGTSSSRALAMLGEAAQPVADWKAPAEALLGRQPVAGFLSWLNRQPADLQPALALAAAMFTAARGDKDATDALRFRAGLSKTSRRLSEWMQQAKRWP